jgi:hypothetical protein
MDFSRQIDGTGLIEGDSARVIGRVIGTRRSAGVVCQFVTTAQACEIETKVATEVNYLILQDTTWNCTN